MNSQQAQAAAKAGLPVKRIDKKEYKRTVFRCINEVIFVYRDNKQPRTRVNIEYLRYPKWEENVPLEFIELIDCCSKCPNKGKDPKLCESCTLYKKPQSDCFDCQSREYCPEHLNSCKGFDSGKICTKYGDCSLCVNLGEDICCDDCIHNRRNRK